MDKTDVWLLTASAVMTSVEQCHHHACLSNAPYAPSSSSSSSSSSYCSTDAAAAAAGRIQVNKKPTSSFRIADILTPSYRHFSDVTRPDHITSTREAMTSSDNDENDGREKYVEVDDVMTSHQQVTSSGDVNALGRLVQMTYNSVDDDDNEQRRHRRPHCHHHHHQHHHRPG